VPGRHRHAADVRTDGLAAVLGRLLDHPAVRSAALVDVDSGMLLDAAGDGDATGPLGEPEVLGALHADLVRAAADLLPPPGDGLDGAVLDGDVLVDSGPSGHHVVRILTDPHGGRLALTAVVVGPWWVVERVRRRLRRVPAEALTAGPVRVPQAWGPGQRVSQHRRGAGTGPAADGGAAAGSTAARDTGARRPRRRGPAARPGPGLPPPRCAGSASGAAARRRPATARVPPALRWRPRPRCPWRPSRARGTGRPSRGRPRCPPVRPWRCCRASTSAPHPRPPRPWRRPHRSCAGCGRSTRPLRRRARRPPSALPPPRPRAGPGPSARRSAA
jgi:hypothetical protein